MGSNTNGALDGRSIAPIPPSASKRKRVKPEADAPLAFLSAVRLALATDDIRSARTLVAAEEARLREDGGTPSASALAEVSAAKARIAMASNDASAAHAILVTAIEAAPDDRALQVLMSEVMLASGRATDVRPVLSHLGKTPTQVLPGDHDPAGIPPRRKDLR
ncbi:hypothetical protein HKCCE4037_10605 [Rhodobacterales bacterium HKCCE4037]|nr:hypothetical protein [Rhodobacterales bacterium HKCCE4037]